MSRIALRLAGWLANVTILATVAQFATAAAPDRPNVIYVFTDQQHAGMLSCAGNPWLKTPAMDSLARAGVRFERAYSVNPVCVPSRTAMLTGHTPSRFGMQSNGEIASTDIPPAVLQQSLGWLFRNAGYETVYGGKTHVPGNITSYGFEVITSDQRQGLADACAEFLKKPHDKPFLLVASFINPHDICYMAINDFAAAGGVEKKRERPKQKQKTQNQRQKQNQKQGTPSAPHQECLAQALQRPAGVSDADFWDKYCPPAPANLEPQWHAPEAVQASFFSGFRRHAFENWTTEQWRLHRWAYCRLTERVDRELGQVLATLRETGLDDKTLIVLSSDHGDMDGSHRLEHKSLFYEEAARVPFVVSYPGVIQPGLVDQENVVSAGLDLIPTLCDYAGIAPPARLMGRSVRGLVERKPAEREYVVSETQYGRMLCSGRYKYCVYESGARRESLVDLTKDPGEMRNVAEDPECQETLQRHRQWMREWVQANEDQIASKYIVP